MAQQHAATRSHGPGRGSLNHVRSSMNSRLSDIQTMIDTGAARAFESLSEILERRPIRIPQLVDVLDSTLTNIDVSNVHEIEFLIIQLYIAY